MSHRIDPTWWPRLESLNYYYYYYSTRSTISPFTVLSLGGAAVDIIVGASICNLCFLLTCPLFIPLSLAGRLFTLFFFALNQRALLFAESVLQFSSWLPGQQQQLNKIQMAGNGMNYLIAKRRMDSFVHLTVEVDCKRRRDILQIS